MSPTMRAQMEARRGAGMDLSVRDMLARRRGEQAPEPEPISEQAAEPASAAEQQEATVEQPEQSAVLEEPEQVELEEAQLVEPSSETPQEELEERAAEPVAQVEDVRVEIPEDALSESEPSPETPRPDPPVSTRDESPAAIEGQAPAEVEEPAPAQWVEQTEEPAERVEEPRSTSTDERAPSRPAPVAEPRGRAKRSLQREAFTYHPYGDEGRDMVTVRELPQPLVTALVELLGGVFDSSLRKISAASIVTAFLMANLGRSDLDVDDTTRELVEEFRKLDPRHSEIETQLQHTREVMDSMRRDMSAMRRDMDSTAQTSSSTELLIGFLTTDRFTPLPLAGKSGGTFDYTAPAIERTRANAQRAARELRVRDRRTEGRAIGQAAMLKEDRR